MSNQARWRWKSGRLTSSPIQDFWGPTLSARDPQIPNLPLETAAAPPAGFPGEDDSWWTGAQRILSGVVIAGAVAALGVSTAIAGSFNKQDEIPAAAGVQSGAESNSSLAGKRVQSRTTFQRWAQPDELPQAVATLALDEPELAQPPPAKSAPVLTLWTAQDEVPQAAVNAGPEDDYWRAPNPLVPPPNLLLWVEGDERPTPATFTPNEEDWRALSIASAPAVLTMWLGADERPTPSAAFTPHEEDAPLPRALVADVNGIFWASEEGTIPASIFADDDYWFVPAKLVSPVLPTSAQQDEIPTGVAQQSSGGAGSPELRGRRALESTKFVFWPSGDDLPTAQAFVPPDDEWAPLRPLSARVVVQTWADDDLGFAAAPIALDDGEWQAPRPVIIAPSVLTLTVVDEIASPAVLQPDEDLWLRFYSVDVLPNLKVWQDQEEIATPPLPLPVEDEYWRAPTPQPVIVRSLADFLTFDEDVGPLVAPVEPSSVGSGGGWVEYALKRKRKTTTTATTETVQESSARLAAVQDALKARQRLRQAERRDEAITAELRDIYAEQDALVLGIVAAQQDLAQQAQDDEDLAIILALAS